MVGGPPTTNLRVSITLEGLEMLLDGLARPPRWVGDTYPNPRWVWWDHLESPSRVMGGWMTTSSRSEEDLHPPSRVGGDTYTTYPRWVSLPSTQVG